MAKNDYATCARRTTDGGSVHTKCMYERITVSSALPLTIILQQTCVCVRNKFIRSRPLFHETFKRVELINLIPTIDVPSMLNTLSYIWNIFILSRLPCFSFWHVATPSRIAVLIVVQNILSLTQPHGITGMPAPSWMLFTKLGQARCSRCSTQSAQFSKESKHQGYVSTCCRS